MSYAQINYGQKLGNGPYTIAEVGCFLTSFSNLLERFGEAVDPPTLNNYFIQHGTFVDVDDGYRDDLAWGSVSAYDGNIATQVGGAGWPQTNNAIVKFVYKSSRTGQQTTHFCLVADWTQRIILDSWDGKAKVSPYGNPVAWASYQRHTVQAVAPPPAPAALPFTVENVANVTKQLKIATKLWNLNQTSWPAMVNNPVVARDAGFQFETSRIAHHALGGQYYIPNDSDGSQGYNIVDCQDPAPAPAPAPAPIAPAEPRTYTSNVVDGITFSVIEGAPKVMYVTKKEGAEKWSLKDVKNWRDFRSVQHLEYGQEVFIVGRAQHPIPPVGATYLMVDADFGNFRNTGNVVNQCGFNQVDLSETRPPALPAPAPVAAPVPEPAPAPAVAAELSWKDTYKPFDKPQHYIAARALSVADLEDIRPPMPLPKYEPTSGKNTGRVAVYGVVTKDGAEYYRLKLDSDKNFEYWYCVPKFDPETRTANLLALPSESTTPVSRATVTKDAIVLAKSHIKINGLEFLDDIIPKFLRNKK